MPLPRLVARPARGSTRGAGVRQRLRLGVADARRRGRSPGRCSSSRCRTSRSSTCPSRRRCSGIDPAFGGGRTHAGASGAGARSRASCFPSCGPALLGGGLLVALHLLAEFGALQMLRFPTFTTAIYEQFGSTFNGAGGQPARRRAGAAAACSLLLVELRLRGRTPALRASAAGAAPSRPSRCASAGPACRSIGVLARGWSVLALGVPIASLVRWMRGRGVDGVPRRRARLARTMTTLGLAAAGRRGARRCSRCPVAWLVVRHARGPRHAPRALHASPRARCPASWSRWPWSTVSIRFDRPSCYQTDAGAARGLRHACSSRAPWWACAAALDHAPPVLEEVSRCSRARAGWATFRRVTLPLVAPGIGAGAALVLHRDRHRADGDPAAGAHRHPHAGDRVLVGARPRCRTARPRRTRCCWCCCRSRPPFLLGRQVAPEELRMSRASRHAAWSSASATAPVLDGLDLDVEDGSIMAVLGPSGCGKTTLLRHHRRLPPPRRGHGDRSATARSTIRRSRVGTAAPRR